MGVSGQTVSRHVDLLTDERRIDRNVRWVAAALNFVMEVRQWNWDF